MEKLIKVGEFPPELQKQINQEFVCHSPDEIEDSDDLRNSVRGIITRSNYRVPLELIERLPALRVISTSGVGYDGIPVAEAQAQGIVVTHTPGVLDAAVCELGVGLLLAMLRQIPTADRYVRDGTWQRGAFPLTSSLQGLRLGIVGLGRIGNGMASRLAPFGVELAYTGGNPQDVPWRYESNIKGLASTSDVLILCCKGGEETYRIVNAEVLAALGRGWVVNMSRGTVIDEVALHAALSVGELKGAALDVFHDEPLGDSALRSLPNVVLSPHAGSATHETRAQMLRLTLDNLHAVLNGRSAPTPVRLSREGVTQ